MTAVFLDTSALVRRYDHREPAANRVRTLCTPASGSTIFLAELARVEVASAFARKMRDARFNAAQRTRQWRVFRGHWKEQYQVIALTDDVCARAERLLFRHMLRAYDALHLASALVVSSAVPALGLEFWTADHQQAAAARVEGLSVTLLT